MTTDIKHLNRALRTLKETAFICHKEWVNRKLAEKNRDCENIQTVSDSDELLNVVRTWDFPKEMDLFYIAGKVTMLEDVIASFSQNTKPIKNGVKKS